MRVSGNVAALALILGAILASGCAARAARDDWAGVPGPEVLAKAQLQYYWRYRVPLDSGATIQRIWRLDENLYALTSGNRLICLDAVVGTYKWGRQVAEAAQTVFAPSHADSVMVPEAGGIAAIINPPDRARMKAFNAVVINTLSYALLLNRDTGEQVRRLPFDFAANTGCSADSTYLYAASTKGLFYAIRLADGLPHWTLSTGDMISTRPKLFNRRLYVASQDARFYAVNPEIERDRKLWTQETDAPLTADFYVDARGCFVPSQDYRLYAYETAGGTDLWTFRTQGPLTQGAQVGAKSVFQYSDNDKFYCIDIANGRERWTSPEARQVLAVVEPNVLALSADGRLLVISETLGKVEMSLPLTGLNLFARNAAKPMIFAAGRDGRFVCIRPAGAGALTAEMLKDEAK